MRKRIGTALLLVLVAFSLATAGTITIPYSFSPGTSIQSAQVNSNFSTIYNEFNGAISDANILTITETKITFTGIGHAHSGGAGGAPIQFVSGSAITSGSSITIPTDGNYFSVTGGTAITAIGTKNAGVLAILKFSGSLVLTHNATSLILPGAANITTAAGDVAVMVSEGSGNWRCLSYQPAAAPALVLLTDQLTGLALSNSGADLAVAVGAAASDDATIANRVLLNLTSGITGKTAGTFVVGTNQNKLDAGAVGNNQTWHVFVIMRPDTGVVDILFSQSATAPTLPTNYTKQRRIGAFLTDGAAAIRAFSQDGDNFLLNAPLLDIDVTNPGTAAVTRTLSVPSGVKVEALLHVFINPVTSSNAAFFVYLSSLDVSDQAPSITVSPLGTLIAPGGGNAWPASGQARVRTNTSAQIRSRCGTASGASDQLKLLTLGWNDRRGKG